MVLAQGYSGVGSTYLPRLPYFWNRMKTEEEEIHQTLIPIIEIIFKCGLG
jgi:hypothetical protein